MIGDDWFADSWVKVSSSSSDDGRSVIFIVPLFTLSTLYSPTSSSSTLGISDVNSSRVSDIHVVRVEHGRWVPFSSPSTQLLVLQPFGSELLANPQPLPVEEQ